MDVGGNLEVTGVCTATSFKGPSGVTATFIGDGSGLTGVTAVGSGVVIKHDGSLVGTATTIDFSTNLDVSAISGAAVTITASGGGATDKIEEGNSKVEVVDTGTGEITFVLDGTEVLNIGGYAQWNKLVYFSNAAQFGQDVQIVDTIKHAGDTNTRIRFPANDTISFETDGSEKLRIGSSGEIGLSGENYGTSGQVLTSGGSGAAASWTTISGGGGGTGGKFVENATGIHTLGNVGVGTTNASGAILNISTGAGVTDTVALDIQGTEGSLFSVTNNLTSGSLFSINDVSGIPAFDYNANGNISMGAFADTVAIGKTSSGVKLGVKGSITEGVHIVANKLSAAPNINVDNGNVHLFTTNETTTATPNITSTVGLNTSLDTGDTLTVAIIYKPNNAGYYAQLTIDGVAQTEEWLGGSAPSSASSGGYDVNTYNIIKTGDAAYIVLANSVNFD